MGKKETIKNEEEEEEEDMRRSTMTVPRRVWILVSVYMIFYVLSKQAQHENTFDSQRKAEYKPNKHGMKKIRKSMPKRDENT